MDMARCESIFTIEMIELHNENPLDKDYSQVIRYLEERFFLESVSLLCFLFYFPILLFFNLLFDVG